MITVSLWLAAVGALAQEPCVDEMFEGECEVLRQIDEQDRREAEQEARQPEPALPDTVAPLAPDEGPAPPTDLETWVEENQFQGGQFFDREGVLVVPDDGSFVGDDYIIEIPPVSPPAPVEE